MSAPSAPRRGGWRGLAMLMIALTALAGAALGAWVLLRPAPATPDASADPPWFDDITAASGVDFVHDPGPLDGRYFMPQIVGSGAALLDCDGDGLLDLYLVNNGGPKGRPNALYLQQPDHTFRDASMGSGLDVAGYGMGVAVGDVDNDGRPDLMLSEYGALRLFLNTGGGRFRPAPDAGIVSPLWGTSCAFADFDRDGLLDLVVVNYVAYDPSRPCSNAAGEADYCHPMVFPGTVAQLFRNRTKPGGPVRFEDVTIASGLGRLLSSGLGVAVADFNGDGWPDIFAANDGRANHLWINQRDGTFSEEAVSAGLAYDGVGRTLGNMGVALGDTQGTGRFDVLVTHLSEETHTLWCQGLRGQFVDRTAESSLTRGKWRGTGFGTVLADFNHDGRLDLAIANGRVVRTRAARGDHFWDAYAERHQLFAGVGPGRFRDVSSDHPALSGTPSVGRALLVGDLDNDGALDLLITSIGGPVRLLRNVAPERGHWLLVRAVDPRLKRDALGAEIIVQTGTTKHVAWIQPGQSYLSSIDPRAHLGLGDATTYDQIRVRWPDGLHESFPGGPADRLLTLRRGEGQLVAP
ncbi:MAG: CRTAC1 family protein [Gemmataceae bacterium]